MFRQIQALICDFWRIVESKGCGWHVHFEDGELILWVSTLERSPLLGVQGISESYFLTITLCLHLLKGLTSVKSSVFRESFNISTALAIAIEMVGFDVDHRPLSHVTECVNYE